MNDGSTSTASVAAAILLSLVVVGASFTLSFNALADLARISGAIPDSLTPLLPVVIDVFILQATWCVYVATKRRDDAGKRYHFAMLAIFSTISIAGNAVHAFLATDSGVAHGLMAVAIAIVAPLALLASIHGLVMHVWTDSGVVQFHEHTQRTSDPSSNADESVAHGAPHAQQQVSAHVRTSTDQPPQDDASCVSFADIDEEMTEEDLQLARLVSSRGRVKHGERTVARALVRERLRAPRDETADLIGVHRTTVGRWVDLAHECVDLLHVDGERTQVPLEQSALVVSR
ncbi:DUF2637 domain-containing protein [Gordonia tangerina]|uniref:DUF2637 domain-containing protein n=1 Tax=Gordonia tangerina TaxID=2911060 RepID=A0ABS9DR60_9ACTN|nr:DUF2637 domain-containing protein [Gordonia tangerina]MCF3940665.1 DUF2637 domain-containing protein [Gordonia tangerina]